MHNLWLLISIDGPASLTRANHAYSKIGFSKKIMSAYFAYNHKPINRTLDTCTHKILVNHISVPNFLVLSILFLKFNGFFVPS